MFQALFSLEEWGILGASKEQFARGFHDETMGRNRIYEKANDHNEEFYDTANVSDHVLDMVNSSLVLHLFVI